MRIVIKYHFQNIDASKNGESNYPDIEARMLINSLFREEERANPKETPH